MTVSDDALRAEPLRVARETVTDTIRFDDGAAYERFMGVWSQHVGELFLDWLAPAHGLRWLDVGCGNGAFTEQIVTRCAPSTVHGIDPSAAQLSFARVRPTTTMAHFARADAMALSFNDQTFEVAVMPLVIFFVPDPLAAVREMSRVVRAEGVVSAYAWDMEGGGFPYATLHDEMRALGMTVPMPPHPEASRLDVLEDLWIQAGLRAIGTRTMTVQRTFESFEDYWETVQQGPSVSQSLASVALSKRARLEAQLHDGLPVDSAGRITIEARAHAIRGHA